MWSGVFRDLCKGVVGSGPCVKIWYGGFREFSEGAVR